MREIALRQSHIAIVDDEDYERLSRFKWYAIVRKKGGNPEARRYAGTKLNKRGKRMTFNISMQTEILGRKPRMVIDHRNGNQLDNRRENLRFCTLRQNSYNRGTQSNNKLGLKGVVRTTAKSPRFGAYIDSWPQGRIWLGSFGTPEEAAQAYNKAALKHFGEFARLNNITETEGY